MSLIHELEEMIKQEETKLSKAINERMQARIGITHLEHQYDKLTNNIDAYEKVIKILRKIQYKEEDKEFRKAKKLLRKQVLYHE